MVENGIELLANAGIDYKAGVKRFMGKTAIYEKVLLNFMNDTALDRAQNSYDEGNIEQLMDDIHEIKGASGNMDMIRLYEVSAGMMELMRKGCFGDSELNDAFESVKTAYREVKAAISAAF